MARSAQARAIYTSAPSLILTVTSPEGALVCAVVIHGDSRTMGNELERLRVFKRIVVDDAQRPTEN